jgi:glycine/D-amino acid oxidase-like deaminating enzyme
MAIAGGRKTIGVIGVGMIGVTTASFLLRRGHDVVLLDPGNPGEGTSFGNAGCFNGSSVVPMSMPGIIRSVPKWLADPLGPLVLRLGYLPSLAPWLIRFIRAGTPDKVRHQARALRTPLDRALRRWHRWCRTLAPRTWCSGWGHLFVYRSLTSWQKERAAWNLRADNGITWDEFDVDELRQLDPNLSREYVKGILIRENGHTTNPIGWSTVWSVHSSATGAALSAGARWL